MVCVVDELDVLAVEVVVCVLVELEVVLDVLVAEDAIVSVTGSDDLKCM